MSYSTEHKLSKRVENLYYTEICVQTSYLSLPFDSDNLQIKYFLYFSCLDPLWRKSFLKF